MKRLVMFLMMALGAGTLLFVGGCGKPNYQSAETQSDAVKTSGTTESHGSSDLRVSTLSNGTKSVTAPPEGGTGIQGRFSLTNTRDPGEEFTVDGPGGEPALTLSGGTAPVGLDDGATNSQGTIRSPDGTVYVGELKDGQPGGQGTYSDPQGTHQRGEFRNGKPYKIAGTWVSTDGIKEEGVWNFDGSRSGGTISWPDGRVYRGDWKNMDGAPEVPYGEGAMAWPDGRKYVGHFRNGKMDGAGRMAYPDGKIQDGLWLDGKFTGSVP